MLLCPVWLLFQVPICCANTEPCLLEGEMGQVPSGNRGCLALLSQRVFIDGVERAVLAGNQLRGQKRCWC